MTPCTRFLLACTLSLILLPGAQAQTRQSFGAWSVVCSGGATGYCSASNRIKSVAGPYRFQLNVSRERPGADFELALLTGYQHPGEGSVITVQVDAGKPLKLAPREGYRRAGRSNTYIVAAGETERLLKQMRAGSRVRFRFEDAKGATVDAAFPLAGLSGATGFMDKMQPAPRQRAPNAAVAPAAKSPVTDTPKPSQEGEAVLSPKPAPAQEPAPARTATPAPIEKGAAPTAAPAPPLQQATSAHHCACAACERGRPRTHGGACAALEASHACTHRYARAPCEAGHPRTHHRTRAHREGDRSSAHRSNRAACEGGPACARRSGREGGRPRANPCSRAAAEGGCPSTHCYACAGREGTTHRTPAPVAKESPAPVPPAKQTAAAAPTSTAARAPIPETKSKPAPAQTAEAALTPAPAQAPATEPKRKPAQAQKQAAVTARTDREPQARRQVHPAILLPRQRAVLDVRDRRRPRALRLADRARSDRACREAQRDRGRAHAHNRLARQIGLGRQLPRRGHRGALPRQHVRLGRTDRVRVSRAGDSARRQERPRLLQRRPAPGQGRGRRRTRRSTRSPTCAPARKPTGAVTCSTFCPPSRPASTRRRSPIPTRPRPGR